MLAPIRVGQIWQCRAQHARCCIEGLRNYTFEETDRQTDEIHTLDQCGAYVAFPLENCYRFVSDTEPCLRDNQPIDLVVLLYDPEPS